MIVANGLRSSNARLVGTKQTMENSLQQSIFLRVIFNWHGLIGIHQKCGDPGGLSLMILPIAQGNLIVVDLDVQDTSSH